MAASELSHAAPAPAPFHASKRSGVTGPLIYFGNETDSGYPRAVVLHDGTLLATYAWDDQITNKIVTKRSYDQGSTWTDPVDVISWDSTKTDLNNPFLFLSLKGELLCAYKQELNAVGGDDYQVNLDVSKSSNGGKSWEKIGSIVSETTNGGTIREWEPFIHEAADGSLQAYYAHDFNPAANDQDVVMRTSTDGGATWSDMISPAAAGDGNTNERAGMPQVVALDDGGQNLLLIYESNAQGAMKVWKKTSTDGGKTWVDPLIIFDPGENASAGGPGVVRVPGLLVVSFMTNQDAPGSDYGDLSNVDMKVITSSDGGSTWSAPSTVIEQAGWGGVTAVEGGVMVLAATKTGKAVMQKFT